MDHAMMRSLSSGGLASPQHTPSLGGTDDAETVANQQSCSDLVGSLIVCAAIFAFICFLACLAWQPIIVKWWRGETDEDNGTSGENTQDDAVLDLQNSILRLMEEGSLPLSSVPPEHRKAYKKCRKAYIERVLIAKHIWLTNEKTQSKDGRFQRKASLLIKEDKPDNSDHEDDPDYQCAICLCPYKDGDEICFSQNEKCQHYFHKSCLKVWLLKHDECPCCRIKYLCRPVVPDKSPRTSTGDDEEC